MPGTPLEGQATPGGLAILPRTLGQLGGAQPLISAIACGDAIPYLPDRATGLYVPVASVFYDTSGNPVDAGDADNNALRVFLVGGGSTVQFQVDSAGFTPGVSGGMPSMYLAGIHPAVPSGAAGAARMSNDRIVQTTGPPRENSVQNTLTLTTTAELTIIPAGAAGVCNDLKFIHISSTSETIKTVVLFRDTLGGVVRFPIAISKSGGSNCPLPYWNQTTPANPWSVQLETPVGPERVFVNVKAEPRTAS